MLACKRIVRIFCFASLLCVYVCQFISSVFSYFYIAFIRIFFDYAYSLGGEGYRKYTLDKVSSILFCISMEMLDLTSLLFFPFPICNDVW